MIYLCAFTLSSSHRTHVDFLNKLYQMKEKSAGKMKYEK